MSNAEGHLLPSGRIAGIKSQTKTLSTVIIEIKIHQGNDVGFTTWWLSAERCTSRAPGMPPPCSAWASRGAAASPEGHNQQTPAAQLGGHPQHGWNGYCHSQRWAAMTRSPGMCAHSSWSKTCLGYSSTFPLVCFLSLFKSLSEFNIFISWTWDITMSSQLSMECSSLVFCVMSKQVLASRILRLQTWRNRTTFKSRMPSFTRQLELSVLCAWLFFFQR